MKVQINGNITTILPKQQDAPVATTTSGALSEDDLTKDKEKKMQKFNQYV
jgi:hypothetical protein